MSPFGFLVGTLAAGCFYAAALAPITNHERALVALVGIVVDWVPVITGWMVIPGDPPPVLFAIHMSFGVVGYALLAYCIVGWLRDQDRSLKTRAAFLGIWTTAYLAGVAMTAGAIVH